MTREEAIRVLEEFQVIDDWTMVHLPPMEDAVNMAIKALEDIERWRTWSHTYDNLISKQDAIDAFGLSEKTRKYGGDHSGYNTMMLYEIQDVLESLPSVDKPTGMWVDVNGEVVCSNCGNSVSFSRTKDGWVFGKFCQTCGAKMGGDDK